MKKIILFTLFVSACFCYAQSPVILPALWYRTDYILPTDTIWHNQTGNTRHAFPQQGYWPDSSLFNYNACLYFDGQASSFYTPITSFSNELTVMIAYQTDDTVSERGLWAFAGDSGRIGISTRRIFGEKTIVGYSDTNRRDAIVNTLTPSWKTGEFIPEKLYIGGTDSLPFEGKLGEVVVFDRKISGKDLLQWQSYLSVKHGITLSNLNYLSSRGDTTWHHNCHPAYAALISGIGRDTAFGLHQKQSIMDNRITIGFGELAASNAQNTSFLPEGHFLIWGVDSNLFYVPQTTYLQNGTEVLTYGNCLMEVTGTTVRMLPTSVRVDVSRWQDAEPLTCVLLIERDQTGDFSGNSVEVYTPVNFDTTGTVTFSGIYWDTDHSGSDLFRIGFIPADSTQISTRSLATTTTGNSETAPPSLVSENRYTLYPNPTSGHYILAIDLSRVSDVVIRVMGSDGKILETRDGKGRNEYRFTGNLPAKGHYLIEIESSLERKTLQIINQ